MENYLAAPVHLQIYPKVSIIFDMCCIYIFIHLFICCLQNFTYTATIVQGYVLQHYDL